MSWDPGAPLYVTQLALQLALCPTWVGEVGNGALAGQAPAGRVHYPAMNLTGKNGPAERTPAIVIARTTGGKRRWIDGAGGLPNGTFELHFYLLAIATGSAGFKGYTIGQAETLAEQVVSELMSQSAGIPFTDNLTWGEASHPTDDALAAHTDVNPTAFRKIVANVPYAYRT